MVICRNCGGNNLDAQLKCDYCGKPLSLIPNDDIGYNISISSHNLNNDSNNNNHNNSNTYTNHNIGANGYKRSNGNDVPYRNNNSNFNTSDDNRNYVNQPIKSSYINNPNLNPNLNSNNNYNDINSTYNNIHNKNSNINPQYKINHLDNDIEFNEHESFNNENYIKKNSIEWDVVIATSLITLISTAVLNRILPNLGLLFAIVIGIIYILIATKVKSSLVKALPVTLVVICAISAFFSL